MTISNYREKKILEAIRALANCYIKLHKGNPGENGTENAAAENKRKKVTFNEPTEEGMLNSADIEWPEVSTTEEITHISLWDAEEGGNCEWYGSLAAAQALIAGNDFRIKKEKLKLLVD